MYIHFFFTCNIDAYHWLETCVLHVLFGLALLVASNKLLLPQTLRVREWISSNGAKTSLTSYYSIACHHINYFILSLSASLCLSIAFISLPLSLSLSLSDISFLSTIENTSFKSYALYYIILPKLNSIRYPFYLKFCNSSSNYARVHWVPSFSEFFWFTFLTELSWSDIPLLLLQQNFK